MDNADQFNENEEETQDTSPETSEDDGPSLKGQGWDILVGGEEHATDLGGDDPFDETPEEDEEADSILGMSADMPAEGDTDEPPPDDAFWDRGKGAEAPAAATADASAEPPPRDLSPEELGASMATPPAEETALHPAPEASPGEPPAPQPVAESSGSESGVSETAPEDMGPEVPADAQIDDMGPSVPAETPAPAAESESGPFGAEAEPFGGSGWAESEPFGGAEASDTAFGGPVPEAMGAEGMGGEEQPPAGPAVEDRPAAPRPMSVDTSVKIDDPFAEEPVAPPRPALTPKQEMLDKFVTDDRINKLWDEIDETYSIVIDDVRGYFGSTEAAIADLKRARELLLNGRENYEEAEELVKRVKARLRLEEKVRQWARKRGSWIAAYLIIWLLMLSSMSIITFQLQEILTAQEVLPAWMAATILPGLFGGLGGVVGALWVLVKHIAKKRDFDPIHTSWYITNPFMGFALGVITYLILLVTGSLMNPGTGVVELASDQISSGVQQNMFTYALCVIVGFNQNVLWALVDRVIKAVIPPEDTKVATEQAASEPTE